MLMERYDLKSNCKQYLSCKYFTGERIIHSDRSGEYLWISIQDKGLCACKNSHLYNKGEIGCYRDCFKWEISPDIESEKLKAERLLLEKKNKDIINKHNEEQEIKQRKVNSEKENIRKQKQSNTYSNNDSNSKNEENSIIGGIIGWIMFIFIVIFIFNLF